MRKTGVATVFAVMCCVAFSRGPAYSAPKTAAKGGVVAIKPVDTAKPAEDTLAAAVGAVPQCTLKVTSDPAGAALYVDDSLKGESPAVIAGVSPGKHVLTLKKKGCFLKKAEITVDAVPMTALSFVLLQPGFLRIETVPAGAEVWIDNKREGAGPYETDRIKPGEHSVKIIAQDYTPLEKSFTVANGGHDTLTLSLKRSRDYLEREAAAQAVKVREHKERVYLSLVSVLFVIGAVVMVFVEAIGN